jgi:hypothetical protein
MAKVWHGLRCRCPRCALEQERAWQAGRELMESAGLPYRQAGAFTLAETIRDGHFAQLPAEVRGRLRGMPTGFLADWVEAILPE